MRTKGSKGSIVGGGWKDGWMGAAASLPYSQDSEASWSKVRLGGKL